MANRTGAAAIVISAGILSAGLVIAGDLTPPAGPVVATMKTLNEVEPRIPVGPTTTPGAGAATYVISQPGTYYLTENILGVAGDIGIQITASNVTLDLNGFTLDGQNLGLDGIDAPLALESITVINGSVINWTDYGVDLRFSHDLHVVDVNASDNGEIGVFVGTGSRVSRCSANGNGNGGINTARGSSISDSVASGNLVVGITAGDSSSIDGCAADSNGFAGISLNSGATAINCSASFNEAIGFYGIAHVQITNCAAVGNGDDGFQLFQGSTVVGCVANSNTGDGFALASATVIRDSTASANGDIGIRISNDSLVLNNICDGNTTSGIGLSSGDTRVEGNNVTDNPIGIQTINSGGNFIVRNTAAGNTTAFSPGTFDKYGPIIALPNGDISATAGADHPWANFIY